MRLPVAPHGCRTHGWGWSLSQRWRALGAESRMDRLAGAVDDRVVIVQDGCDVRSGENRAELERELVGVGAGREFVSSVRLAGGIGQELPPLSLIEGDAVAYWSVPAPGASLWSVPRPTP